MIKILSRISIFFLKLNESNLISIKDKLCLFAFKFDDISIKNLLFCKDYFKENLMIELKFMLNEERELLSIFEEMLIY